MNKINFYNLMTLCAKSLNTVDSNIIEELTELKSSSTGEISLGLKSELKGNKLTVSSGFGFSSKGELQTLKADTELILPIENSEYFLIYILNSKLGYATLLNEPEDPYELKLIKDQNLLAISIIISSEVYSLNKTEDNTDLPVGTVLYYIKDVKFRDYYSIKGFKKLNEKSKSKFALLNSKSDLCGGSNEIMLSSLNLPSFVVKGQTEVSGLHSHSYQSFKSLGGAFGLGGAWLGTVKAEVQSSGSHTHSLNLNFENKNQKPIYATPKSVTVLPIIKVY